MWSLISHRYLGSIPNSTCLLSYIRCKCPIASLLVMVAAPVQAQPCPRAKLPCMSACVRGYVCDVSYDTPHHRHGPSRGRRGPPSQPYTSHALSRARTAGSEYGHRSSLEPHRTGTPCRAVPCCIDDILSWYFLALAIQLRDDDGLVLLEDLIVPIVEPKRGGLDVRRLDNHRGLVGELCCELIPFHRVLFPTLACTSRIPSVCFLPISGGKPSCCSMLRDRASGLWTSIISLSMIWKGGQCTIFSRIDSASISLCPQIK